MIDDNVQYENVDSSNLYAVGYDPKEENLFIIFQNKTGGPGRRYSYYHVPTYVHAELMAAPSKGSYLNAHIKGSFSYDEIT